MILLFLSTSLAVAQDLEIEQFTNYHDGNWVVAGLIKNNGDSPAQFVEVELLGYDEEDNLVHTDTSYAFAPIPPQSSVPFTILTGKDDAGYIAKYRIQIINYRTGGSGTYQFEFDQLRITDRNNTFHEYTGIIHNRTGQLRQRVEIAMMGFDTDGKVVFVDTTYANRTSLPADAESTFEFLISPHLSRQIDTYRLLAYARN
jgi:hypothetical protein